MNFKAVNREQMLLLPPSLDEWLPEEHLAWFILDAVEEMDLSGFYAKYRSDGTGQAAYHPQMLLAVLLYGYCRGERSSRKLEQRCQEDVAFRVLAANQNPDHCTLARFRQDFETELSAVFTQVLRLCQKAGLLKVGKVALDGTKLKANAALDANKTLAGIEAEVKRMLSEAQHEDEREDQLFGKDKRGDELPADLRERGSRRARLKECKERLEQEAAESRRGQEEKLAAREKEEQERGEKLRGRKPLAPEEKVDPDSKANVTDPQSRIMKTRSGYVQGYNGQALVDEGQVIIAADVTDEENDQRQFRPMLGQAQANLAAVKAVVAIGAVLLDAGYCSEETLSLEGKKVEDLGRVPELFCATAKGWKVRQALREHGPPRGRRPQGLNARERMERKLRTKRGRKFYSKRGEIVESIFGQIDTVQDGKQCSRRGLTAARSEWRFTCAASNLLKLWRRQRAGI